MRNGERRPDGTVSLSKLETAQKDLQRYLLFRQGLSVHDIARAESGDVAYIEKSLKRGRHMFEGDQQMRLRDAKYEAAIDNEQIRKSVRNKIAKKLVESIDRLLDGTRTIVEVNKITGEVKLHDIVDPEIVAIGVEAARKTISLEERPQAPTVAVNIQNNNNNEGGGGRALESFEERIERIRLAQRSQTLLPETSESEPVIDVTPTETSAAPPAEPAEEPLF